MCYTVSTEANKQTQETDKGDRQMTTSKRFTILREKHYGFILFDADGKTLDVQDARVVYLNKETIGLRLEDGRVIEIVKQS
jgi:hypothetical protein